MKKVVYTSPWHLIYLCTMCREILDKKDIDGNDGICPHCGHQDKSKMKINHVKKIGRKIVETNTTEDISTWPDWRINVYVNLGQGETRYEYKETI